MAVVIYDETAVDGGVIVSWLGLGSGDTGLPYQPRKSLSVAGSVQVGGTAVTSVAMQQSNDGTAYFTMQGAEGEDVTFTAAGIKEFSSSSRYVRPSVTTGTAVNFYMFLRG